MQTGITGTQNATASFLQLDAKLVVAGNGVYDDGTVQKSGTYVARYDTAGTLDLGYGDSGVKKLNAIKGFESVGTSPRRQPAACSWASAPPPTPTTDIYVVKLTRPVSPTPPSVVATASSR